MISAILKYHNTERMRKTLNDAMDVHGGRAVVLGPRNYLAAAYQAIPVAITVEGANILTRSMIIFGQGAIRCHPYVLKEMRAAMDNDDKAFNQAFGAHLHFAFTNAFRSVWLSLTNGAFSAAPKGNKATAVYYRRLNRVAANFALVADMSMFSLGGSLKFKEKLSARLGDILSNLFIASAVLKRFESQGSPKEDEAIMRYAAEQALFDAQTALDGLLRNLPMRPLAWLLRALTMPLGHNLKAPADKLASKVAADLMKNEAMLTRLTHGMFVPDNEDEAIGLLPIAHAAVIAAEPAEKKLRNLTRKGELVQPSPALRLQEALDKGAISQSEFDEVTHARQLKRNVIMVDDFDMKLEQHDAQLLQRHVF